MRWGVAPPEFGKLQGPVLRPGPLGRPRSSIGSNTSDPASSPARRTFGTLGAFDGRGPIVSDERWFCRDEAEWAAIVERLKLTPCPHCRTVGTLIRHGVLTGFDDSSSRRTVRARRIFCSNRHRRCGCGRTVSVWFTFLAGGLPHSPRNLRRIPCTLIRRPAPMPVTFLVRRAPRSARWFDWAGERFRPTRW